MAGRQHMNSGYCPRCSAKITGNLNYCPRCALSLKPKGSKKMNLLPKKPLKSVSAFQYNLGMFLVVMLILSAVIYWLAKFPIQ